MLWSKASSVDSTLLSTSVRSRKHLARPPRRNRFPPYLPRRSSKALRRKRGTMLIPQNLSRPRTIAVASPRGPDRKNVESREIVAKADLSRRLKGVCSHLSKVDFDILMCDMTREQLRGERIPTRKVGPSD